MVLMKRMSVAAALLTLLVPAGFSQTHKSKPVVDRSHAVKKAAGKSAKPRGMANAEVYVDVTIGPGQSAVLDSGFDYTDADMVRVSVQSADFDLGNLQLQAYWSVPDANFYNLTDVVDGSTFIAANVGGAPFMVYGSQFRLVLMNTGSSTITLVQVMVFPHVTPAPPPDPQ